jgi:hypothetical protein
MAARKRARDEMDEAETHGDEPSTLHRLRNMWQFANLGQFLVLFGDAIKVDKDFDIEVRSFAPGVSVDAPKTIAREEALTRIQEMEAECLKPQASDKLAQVGLALLKHVSSHKGLTREIFDEYTRRQYVAKAPARNPFGTDEEPNRFDDFDVYTKIKVLQQLATWTLNNPNTVRERLTATENDQTLWVGDAPL